MLLTNIINGLASFLQWILDLLPTIPETPEFIVNNVNAVLNFIFNNIQLFELFIPLELVGVLLPLAIIVANLNRLWGVLRLIYRLIPVIGKN